MKENTKDPKSELINHSEVISTKKVDPQIIPESQKDIDPMFRTPRPRLYRNL